MRFCEWACAELVVRAFSVMGKSCLHEWACAELVVRAFSVVSKSCLREFDRRKKVCENARSVSPCHIGNTMR